MYIVSLSICPAFPSSGFLLGSTTGECRMKQSILSYVALFIQTHGSPEHNLKHLCKSP